MAVVLLVAGFIAWSAYQTIDSREVAGVACDVSEEIPAEGVTSTTLMSPSAVAAAQQEPSPTPDDDQTETDEPSGGGVVGDDGASESIEAETTRSVEIHFGRVRSLRGDQILFPAPAGLTLTSASKLGIDKEVLRREEANGSIGARKPFYDADAQVTASGQIRFKVCIDAENQRIDPGTYRGNIGVVYQGQTIALVPVEVTLQFADWGVWALIFGTLILIGGPFFVWASGRKEVFIKEDSTKRPTWKDVPHTLNQLYFHWLPFDNFMGLFVGVFAAFSAFIATYWSNPAWGAKAPNDWVTLLAAMFTAFTTGLAAGSAASDPPSEIGKDDGSTSTQATVTPPPPSTGG